MADITNEQANDGQELFECRSYFLARNAVPHPWLMLNGWWHSTAHTLRPWLLPGLLDRAMSHLRTSIPRLAAVVIEFRSVA
jgi:hypothetical protein